MLFRFLDRDEVDLHGSAEASRNLLEGFHRNISTRAFDPGDRLLRHSDAASERCLREVSMDTSVPDFDRRAESNRNLNPSELSAAGHIRTLGWRGQGFPVFKAYLQPSLQRIKSASLDLGFGPSEGLAARTIREHDEIDGAFTRNNCRISH
jgi:hypothetical protein